MNEDDMEEEGEEAEYGFEEPLTQNRPEEEFKEDSRWQAAATEAIDTSSNRMQLITAKELTGIVKTKRDVFNILSREGTLISFSFRLTVLAALRRDNVGVYARVDLR